MLVRHVLSQLSYAPEPASVLLTSATGFIIHVTGAFVKGFFQKFCCFFIFLKYVPILSDFPTTVLLSRRTNQIFLINFCTSSGVKR